VIPVVRPTVPNAEIASKSASFNEHLSNTRSPIVDNIINTRAVSVSVKALYMALSGSLLFKRLTLFLPLIELTPAAVTVTKVVVFMPPPVPPGEAPINIRRERKKRVKESRKGEKRERNIGKGTGKTEIGWGGSSSAQPTRNHWRVQRFRLPVLRQMQFDRFSGAATLPVLTNADRFHAILPPKSK